MELVNIEENKNNVVKKHQELVHNARYRLSELSLKVLSVLISMIKMSDTEFTEYTLKLSDFKELIGSDSKKTYDYTHKMIKDLIVPVQIGDMEMPWVTFGEYQKGSNIVTFEIHRKLKPYLLELKEKFLQYNITNILPLKSAYIIRLYEICKDHFVEGTRYKKSRQSIQFELKIERMRELFEIPESYQYSSHIKKRILDKAVEQFKEKTDIQISYVEQKIGRKIDRIIITVKENNKGSNDYLSHRQAFIKHIRANYVNQVLLRTKDKYTNGDIILSVDQNGKLYSQNGIDFDAERSNEMWDTLFRLAKEDDLSCLKQGALFDDNTPVIDTTKKENYAVKANPILSIEQLSLDDKFINFAKSTNLDDNEIETEFLMFRNHHLGEGTEPNRNWYKLWCGWISNGNQYKKRG